MSSNISTKVMDLITKVPQINIRRQLSSICDSKMLPNSNWTFTSTPRLISCIAERSDKLSKSCKYSDRT